MSTLSSTAPGGTARLSRAALLRILAGPLAKAVVVALLVVLITFVLGKLVLENPGRLVLGTTATPAQIAAFNSKLGLNHSILLQIGWYYSNLFHGRLGQSYGYVGTSVWSLVRSALLVSAVVAVITVIVSVLVCLPLGILAAQRKGKLSDYLVRGGSVVGMSAPSAFVGLVLIRLVGVGTGILPAGGWGHSTLDDAKYLVLPVATLTIYLSPILIRIVRERAIFVLTEPYVEAATARGVPRLRVIVNHVIPNSIGPLLTVIGFNFGGLLSGSVIADVVFGLPGLGSVLTTAVTSGDLAVIQAVALLAGLMVTLANAFAEIAQRLIDPRLRA